MRQLRFPSLQPVPRLVKLSQQCVPRPQIPRLRHRYRIHQRCCTTLDIPSMPTNPIFLASYKLTFLVKSTSNPVNYPDESEVESQRKAAYGYNFDHYAAGDRKTPPVSLFNPSLISVNPVIITDQYSNSRVIDNPHNRQPLTKQLIDTGVHLTQHPTYYNDNAPHHEHTDYHKVATDIHLTSRVNTWGEECERRVRIRTLLCTDTLDLERSLTAPTHTLTNDRSMMTRDNIRTLC